MVGAVHEQRNHGTWRLLPPAALSDLELAANLVSARVVFGAGLLLAAMPIAAFLPLWGGAEPLRVLLGYGWLLIFTVLWASRSSLVVAHPGAGLHWGRSPAGPGVFFFAAIAEGLSYSILGASPLVAFLNPLSLEGETSPAVRLLAAVGLCVLAIADALHDSAKQVRRPLDEPLYMHIPLLLFNWRIKIAESVAEDPKKTSEVADATSPPKPVEDGEMPAEGSPLRHPLAAGDGPAAIVEGAEPCRRTGCRTCRRRGWAIALMLVVGIPMGLLVVGGGLVALIMNWSDAAVFVAGVALCWAASWEAGGRWRRRPATAGGASSTTCSCCPASGGSFWRRRRPRR